MQKMAQSNLLLILSILSIFFSFFFIVSVQSRNLQSQTPHTQILDVSASLQQAQEILSFDPQTITPFYSEEEEEAIIPPSTSSAFSVPLHTRHSHHRHKDYRSLTLSRLARDSARVNSINSKLQFALTTLNKSDLIPLYSEITTPIVSGTSQGSGEYFSRIGIGSPPKHMSLAVDTGSDVSWIQCQPCMDCYQQSDPTFDPASSSSYSPLTCDSQTCKSLEVSACRSGACLYQVSYGDGSYTVGDFATETVSFGTSGSVPKLAIGCGHDNEGLFVGSAGLLGLGGGALSLPSQLKATSFSYCLVNRDSTKSSTLEFNTPRPGDSVVTQLSKNSKVDTFFYVGVTGMSVGGHTLSIPASLFQMDVSGKGGIIVDSGTAITRLQTQAYESLRDAFKKYTPNLPSTTGFSLFDTCYDLSSMKSVRVPTVSFNFAGGKSLSLPASNYLLPVDSSGTFCFAFAPTSSSLSIIGNVQQQGTRVSYDLANSLVGFSPNKC